MSESMRVTITPEILLLVAEIDEFKGAWQLLTRLAPHRARELQKGMPANITDFASAAFTEEEIKALYETVFHAPALLKDGEVATQLRELVTWTSAQLETKTLHPLFVIGIFAAIFLGISPFQTGNTRLSNALTTGLLLKSGYGVAEIENTNAEVLVQTLASLQTTQPNFHPWLLTFLRSLRQQKLDWEQRLFPEDEEMSPLSAHILTLLKTHERLAIREVEALTKANRNTLKKHLQALTNKTHIVKHGAGRATWYTAA